MGNDELLYGHPSLLVVSVLFVLMVVANAIGFRVGRASPSRDDDARSLTSAILGSVLGLLALLLGFTFAMSMQRYDERSGALIAEANAIGTAMLRVDLLPEAQRARGAQLFRDYLDVRIAMARITLPDAEARAEQSVEAARLQDALWALAMDATRADPRPVTSGNFLVATNDLIDREGERSALLNLHVPEVVLLLLFVVFIAAGGFLGHACGLADRRLLAPTSLVAFLISLIVFIIIDLDRPRRGVIQIDASSLVTLRERST